jgi:CheY-like chemotaxis protein
MNNLSRVVIIDDSPTECRYMSQVLLNAGYQVNSVMNGREGLNVVLAEHPQCLILDIVLPEMNGYEICRHLRAQAAFKQLPIIMVSTKKTVVDANWALRQGVNHYLPKPFRQEQLLALVQESIGEPMRTETGFMSRPSSTRPSPLRAASPQTVLPRSVPPTSSKPLLLSLIPQHIVEKERVRETNPRLTIFPDRVVRYVYSLIDGRSNIERLCLLSQMPLDQMRSVLRLLFEQQRIQLYTPGGQRVDGLLFLKEN